MCLHAFRAEIEALEREQEEVLKDLRLIESRSNQNKDDKNCEDLGDLGREKRKSFLTVNVSIENLSWSLRSTFYCKKAQ